MTDTRWSTGRPPRVVSVGALFDPAGEHVLRAAGVDLVHCGSDWHELKEAVVGADGLIIRPPARFDGELSGYGSQLSVVATPGAGYENVDVEVATSAGVLVMHTGGVGAVGVVEYVLGALVVCARRITVADAAIRRGEVRWTERIAQFASLGLAGKTLGIVGFGRIGRLLAERAQLAFGLTVIAHDPLADPMDGPVPLVDLDHLLAKSDFVSLHLPHTAQTRGLLDADRLGLLKPTASLINCSRGGIVDEAALTVALASGRVAFAVSDVFASEPDVSASPLVSAPNCLLTPHVAGLDDNSRRNLAEELAHNVICAFEGTPNLGQVVNPGVLSAPELRLRLRPASQRV